VVAAPGRSPPRRHHRPIPRSPWALWRAFQTPMRVRQNFSG
jgi:hypothetical protein